MAAQSRSSRSKFEETGAIEESRNLDVDDSASGWREQIATIQQTLSSGLRGILADTLLLFGEAVRPSILEAYGTT